ncbi:MAG: ABC transporter ATP-binding protein [Bullifex sp.]|nr:ABC transporter ATP-binding protein [Spirochaetales bacterium]MDY2815306.1 ABC transporter ATP-binding protein [Bullifex sp.]MDY3851222.1 ABC transporter ATP-binding protein [Bullifex sp.]MDY4799684.1 ABC transporter ATP-binding protein [Bullifex sp.]MDY5056131.1 ABC transporter ATP-binding protein [Bullifex sp.]
MAKGLDFTVAEGDYLCILGDNGAGKSTLVKAILSLHEPLSGSLEFTFPRSEIGYLPQRTEVRRDFPSSVWEVVLSGCVNSLSHRLFYGRKDRMTAEANLERMEISDLRKQSFSNLSGGQQQRVLLARALCAAKKVLLLDEPVAGLDSHTSSELYRLIDDLNRDGMTVIMVTHDVHPALNSAGKILHLGRTFFFGLRDEYFKSEVGKRYLEESGHHD